MDTIGTCCHLVTPNLVNSDSKFDSYVKLKVGTNNRGFIYAGK